MDENKKKAIVIGLVIVGVIAAGVSFMKSGVVGGDKENVVGSLEEGVNHKTGLPLDPPKSQGAEDPSSIR